MARTFELVDVGPNASGGHKYGIQTRRGNHADSFHSFIVPYPDSTHDAARRYFNDYVSKLEQALKPPTVIATRTIET
jgi:hypothetical protein